MLPDTSDRGHAAHFESLEQQAHAAHFGMWVFLASEVLLFAGLFALYAVYRAQHPQGFNIGLEHSEKSIGSINTAILLASSYAVATSVLTLRARKRALTIGLLLATIGLGIVFIGLKFYEYSLHFHEGIWPGGQGLFFQKFPVPGVASFWTLYYVMTGLHVIHVTAGLCVLSYMTFKVARGTVIPPHDHPLALSAMYWHLVDIIWIFLWPLFYLTARPS
ncbi:MAG: cytochrome c oxidase subunit 3 family protein [Polyangiales bacterium]